MVFKVGKEKVKIDNKGSAIIVALVAGVVIMAFALSLLLVAYTLYAQTSRRNTQLQCKEMAESLVVGLGTELDDPEDELVKYFKEQMKKNDSNKWIPIPENDEDDFNPAGAETGGKTHLYMDFTDNSNILSNYSIEVDFSYTYDGDLIDEDAPAAPAEIDYDLCTIHAKVKVVKGSENDRDAQVAIVEKDYKAGGI